VGGRPPPVTNPTRAATPRSYNTEYLNDPFIANDPDACSG
jgi:hypothetical protein